MKDTVYTVSSEAINTVNHIIVDLKACNELADSLWSEIETRHRIEANDNKIIDSQQIQIYNLQSQIKETNTIIDLTDKQLKRANRKIKFQKILLYIAGGVIIAESGYIGIQSIKN